VGRGGRHTLLQDRQYVPERLKRTASTAPSWPLKQNASSVGRCSVTSLLGLAGMQRPALAPSKLLLPAQTLTEEAVTAALYSRQKPRG